MVIHSALMGWYESASGFNVLSAEYREGLDDYFILNPLFVTGKIRCSESYPFCVPDTMQFINFFFIME